MSKGNTFCVYGLRAASDLTRTIRYIGKSQLPAIDRLRHHVWAAQHGYPSYKFNWMRSVFASGDCVVMDVLVIVDDNNEACRIERALISHLPNLTNATAGGEGRVGYVMPDSVKRRISEAQRGRPLTEAHRRALSKAATGKRFKCSDIARQNMRSSWTPERRAAFAASRQGRSLTAEHRAAIKSSWSTRRLREVGNV